MSAASQPVAPAKMSLLRQIPHLLPGVGLSAVIAMAATTVSILHGGPQFLYALFFGIAFHYLSQETKTRPGIEFCARGVLRLGVGLLGARITASQIAGLGWETAAIVVIAVVSTLLCGTLLGKRFGLTRAQGVLSGGAVAICGASAALAISAVLPREKDSDRSTLMVVVTVTVLSTVAMVVYPLIVKALGLPPELAGLFLGVSPESVAEQVGNGGAAGLKATVVEAINEGLAGHRSRRAELARDPAMVTAMLHEGNARANEVAQRTLATVRAVMGMAY